jgi:hypothetical protein
MTMSQPTATRILFADDHALVRREVRLILEDEPEAYELTVCGDPCTIWAADTPVRTRSGASANTDTAQRLRWCGRCSSAVGAGNAGRNLRPSALRLIL